MKAKFILALLITLFLGVSSAFAQENVRISDLNWTGAKAIGHVIKAVGHNESYPGTQAILKGRLDQRQKSCRV